MDSSPLATPPLPESRVANGLSSSPVPTISISPFFPVPLTAAGFKGRSSHLSRTSDFIADFAPLIIGNAALLKGFLFDVVLIVLKSSSKSSISISSSLPACAANSLAAGFLSFLASSEF